MKRKKMRLIGIMMCIVIIWAAIPIKAEVMAAAQDGQNIEDESQKVLDFGLDLFNWKDIKSLENELAAQMPHLSGFHLEEEVRQVVTGEKTFSLEEIVGRLLEALWGEGKLFIQLGARFVLIVLMCNLLQSLSSSFKSKETTKVAFFVGYLVIIYSVIQSFMVMVELAKHVLDALINMMLVCVPTLLAFMTTTGYMASASAIAPVIIGTLTLCSKLMEEIVLPCIISVIILEMVGSMSENYKVDKLVKLFYRGIKMALKLIFGISMGVLSLYRLTMPYTDMTLKKATLRFSTAFIPLFGNAAQSAVEWIAQCGGLIRNAFSAGVILWIVLLISLPLFKILIYTVVYHVAGALIEPLGDKKMADLATRLGKGSEFILSTVGMVALICICSLLICMSIGMNVV